MARTALVPIVPLGSTPVLPLVALSAAMALTAADIANGNSVPSTGRELIIVQNSDAAPQTVTVASVVDRLNRTGDITAYSIPIGAFAVLGPFKTEGWRQADGNLYLNASTATVKFAVIQLPPVL
ncbi:MAG: hypothetical protein M3O87_08205 [Candidatus Dormibacteraeota bacterium]|nr:hypothetical protein [Candidatus Dormibacteraeota bacterium]